MFNYFSVLCVNNLCKEIPEDDVGKIETRRSFERWYEKIYIV
jgi:hypothetical protein